MQMNEAKRLARDWGDKPCDHSHLVKEYIKGSETNDWVCTTCGADFLKKERDEMIKLKY